MRTITQTVVVAAAAAALAVLSLPVQAITTPSVPTASSTHIQWGTRRSSQTTYFHRRHHRRHHRRYHRMYRSMNQGGYGSMNQGNYGTSSHGSMR
jgi:hypothetical protein